ncbi:lipopolysaccharide biosynthesis protein [Aquimarina sp. 2304DJ70-9]|uniref:lipopolysaccharide biosynthesis protein n=1 Tax=Aquimarina penaris TaxID=3231044 RepID=UPI00346346C1
MLKKILTFSSSYVAIEALQKGVMFFLMSLFTHHMTTEEYGIISSALMIIQVLAIVFSLSTTASISRYYFKFYENKDDLKDFLGTSFLFILVIGLFFLLLFLIFGKFIFQWIFPEIPYYPIMIWVFLLCVLQPFNMAYLGLLKSQLKLKKYSILYSVYYVLQFALMAITILVENMKHEGYILSLLLSNIVFMLIVSVFLIKEINFCIKKEYLKLSLQYSLSFIPAEIFAVVNALIDRFFILSLLTLSALGIYHIAIQIGAIIVLITRALNYAYLPHFMKIYESGKKDFSEIYKFADLSVLITVLITGYLSIVSPYFIEYFLDKSYIDAKNVVVYINFLYALNSVFFINVNVLSLTPKLVRSKTIVLIFGGIINFLLNYILIKQYDLIGAAIATLAGFIITNLLLGYWVKLKTTFTFKSFKNLFFIVLSMLCTVFILRFSSGYIILDLVLMLASFTIFSVLIFGYIHRLNPLNLIKIKF